MHLASLLVGVLAGALLTAFLLGRRTGAERTAHAAALARAETRGAEADARTQRADERERLGEALAPLGGGLARLEERLAGLESGRRVAETRLQETVRGLHGEVERVGRVAGDLAGALTRPTVVGAWGELTLRRVLELAGLPRGAVLAEQVPLAGGRLRPDAVVTLPGSRPIAIDSKVPTDAWLQACAAEDGREQEAALLRHARAVRSHVERLSAKDYPRAMADGPAFVVLFLPGEALAGEALRHDPTLLEHAARRDVLIATPATLIGLLRAVGHVHGQAALAAEAGEIAVEARELHARARTFLGHLGEVGDRLRQAGEAYDRAVGSAQSRLLPGLRRLGERAAPGAAPFAEPQVVALRPRAPDRRSLDEAVAMHVGD